MSNDLQVDNHLPISVKEEPKNLFSKPNLLTFSTRNSSCPKEFLELENYLTLFSHDKFIIKEKKNSSKSGKRLKRKIVKVLNCPGNDLHHIHGDKVLKFVSRDLIANSEKTRGKDGYDFLVYPYSQTNLQYESAFLAIKIKKTGTFRKKVDAEIKCLIPGEEELLGLIKIDSKKLQILDSNGNQVFIFEKKSSGVLDKISCSTSTKCIISENGNSIGSKIGRASCRERV